LTYIVEVETSEPDWHWFQSFINAADGTTVAHNDFVAHSSYNAVDLHVQDVTEKYGTYTNPEDKVASPNGWHTVSGTTSTDTSGNNAITYKGSTSSTTKQSAAGNVFNYKYDTTQDPTAGDNVKAATVNTFHLVNRVHDITYRYGFTESTFNFQQDVSK
jgi:extracellular elastinolytic metalloproteinase